MTREVKSGAMKLKCVQTHARSAQLEQLKKILSYQHFLDHFFFDPHMSSLCSLKVY